MDATRPRLLVITKREEAERMKLKKMVQLNWLDPYVPIIIAFRPLRLNNRTASTWLLRRTIERTAAARLLRRAGVTSVGQHFTLAFLNLSLFVVTVRDGWKARITIAVVVQSRWFIVNRPRSRWNANFPETKRKIETPSCYRRLIHLLDLKFAERQIILFVVRLLLLNSTQIRKFATTMPIGL